jgi:hypothetical protein
MGKWEVEGSGKEVGKAPGEGGVTPQAARQIAAGRAPSAELADEGGGDHLADAVT